MGLGYKFRPLLAAARGYSTWQDVFSLEKFRRRFEAYLRGLRLGARALLISAEELSGHLPGRESVADYRAAPVLALEIYEALRAAFPQAEISFVYTLRRPETWWPSAYWEHVKSSRLTLEYADFLARFGAMDLATEASNVQLDCAVETLWLEDIASEEHGPAAPLLRRVGLSDERWAQLKPVAQKNRAPQSRPELIEQFLQLNRSDLDQAALTSAKKALLDAAEGT